MLLIDLKDKKRQEAVEERRSFLINELYKMGITETSDGRQFEDCSLFTLEHVHISEKCNASRAFGDST